MTTRVPCLCARTLSLLFGIKPRKGCLGPTVTLDLAFWGEPAALFHIPTSSVRGSRVLIAPHACYAVCFFLCRHRSARVPLWFWSTFPWWLMIHSIPSQVYCHSTYFLKPILHFLPTKTHEYYLISFVCPILKYLFFNFFSTHLHSRFPPHIPRPLHCTYTHTPHTLSQMIPLKTEFDALSQLLLNLNQTSAAKPSKVIAICQI